MAFRVFNLMGRGIGEQLTAALPEVEVVDVGRDETPAEPADVAFGWNDSPGFVNVVPLVPWVHLAGTGVDRVARDFYDGRIVTCSRGVSAVPIAEFVLAEILAFEKRFPDVWLDAPPAHWNISDLGELEGKTVAILGLGGIGTAIARRVLAFDVHVRALRRDPARGAPEGVELAGDVVDLVRGADHLVLAAPATDATRHVVGDALLAHVKPGLHLVNIARGALVDQEAMRIALDDGRVARASLDCVDPEPLPEGHWLYSHPKVKLSAHVSWASPKAMGRVVSCFVANVRHRLAGEPLDGVVDPDAGY